jgi:hypothetical protein
MFNSFAYSQIEKDIEDYQHQQRVQKAPDKAKKSALVFQLKFRDHDLS